MDNITKVFEALGEKIKNLEFDNQMKDMQIEHLKKEIERLKPEKESRPGSTASGPFVLRIRKNTHPRNRRNHQNRRGLQNRHSKYGICIRTYQGYS